jgi:hypothetical protein
MGGTTQTPTTQYTGGEPVADGNILDTIFSGAKDILGQVLTPENIVAGGTTIYNVSQQQKAAEEMRRAIERGQDISGRMFDITRADLAPYRVSPEAAIESAGFRPDVGMFPTPELGGPLTEGLPQFADYQDPAYEWLRKEGMRDIESRAAAQGLLGTGGTLQSLVRQNVGLAGQQMGKVAQMREQMFRERLAEQQQRFGQAADLRRQLFGEQLSADELDFMQQFNLAQMGAGAAARAGQAAMQQGRTGLEGAIAEGKLGVASTAGQAEIINDIIRSMFF